MDDIYADDYNMPKSKTGKTLRIIAIILIIALYVTLMCRLFVSCDSDLIGKIILDNNLAADYAESVLALRFPILNPENRVNLADDGSSAKPFLVYEYSPITTMDSDGRVQTRFATYIAGSHNFQVTVKLNNKYYAAGDNFDRYYFELEQVTNGHIISHSLSFSSADEGKSYSFYRLAFDGITINDGDQIRLVMYHPGDETHSPTRVMDIKLVGTPVTTGTTPTSMIKNTETTEAAAEEIFHRQLNTLELDFKRI